MVTPRELTLVSIILRILLSIVLGGVIGIERGLKNRPAGFRTYMLVSLGSCIVMMINQYIFQIYHTGDPVRLGAQVISGIGFLGAGTIITTSHNQIKGLTTAAGLWASACVGLAIGIGLYEVALIGAGSVFLILTLLHTWDNRMRGNSRILELYVELTPGYTLGAFLQGAHKLGIELSNLQKEQEGGFGDPCFTFLVTAKSKKRREDMVGALRKMEGVALIEVL